MKKLTLTSALLVAVASLTAACTSQEATIPSEVTTLPEVAQPQGPATAPLPEIQSLPQDRSAIEATDPSLPEQDPVQFIPEPSKSSNPSQSKLP